LTHPHPKETANRQDPVTAIDVVLEPDATMLAHARAANARLLETFPEGFPLDAGHAPHITMLIQYVRTADLDAVGAAVETVFDSEHPAGWTLTASGRTTTTRCHRWESRESSSNRPRTYTGSNNV
jgi:hypothetical protein